jgi:hypothetical protein
MKKSRQDERLENICSESQSNHWVQRMSQTRQRSTVKLSGYYILKSYGFRVSEYKFKNSACSVTILSRKTDRALSLAPSLRFR